MTISAVMLGVTGIILSFIPQEVSHFLSLTDSTPIVFQILGALYFGFAMLNWTAKANLIGGIYSRPVAIGNFTHFLIGGLALIKLLLHNTNRTSIWVCAIMLYLIFAVLFGYVLFNNPASTNKSV
jgi:ATP/ADP translocase